MNVEEDILHAIEAVKELASNKEGPIDKREYIQQAR